MRALGRRSLPRRGGPPRREDSRPSGGGRVKLSTVESGMPLLDQSHKRISIAFFLVAIDFIVFDLEAAFLYS